MINGLKNKDVITEEQQRLRNMELIGLKLTEEQKDKLEYHRENKIDFDEVLREMGYYDEENEIKDDKNDKNDEENDISDYELDELVKNIHEEMDIIDDEFGCYKYEEEEEIDVNKITQEELKKFINQLLTDRK